MWCAPDGAQRRLPTSGIRKLTKDHYLPTKVRASCPTARPAHATPHFSFRPYRVAASVVPIPNRRCADANCALMSAFLADRTSAARDDVAKRPRKHASQRRTRHRGARRSIAVAAAARVTAPAAAVPIPPPPARVAARRSATRTAARTATAAAAATSAVATAVTAGRVSPCRPRADLAA